ncbi:hypothetical protein BDZ45DRAFT_740354 [Acephala macrosclerotiorum]|nr:hypothetical protein BDZ45DRAFT_740354 [Acephala macrosclerotiorum]
MIICLLQAVYLTFRLQVFCTANASRKGFATEWDVLTPAIEIELVRYTNAFRYNATDKSYYREFDPAESQYVGTLAENGRPSETYIPIEATSMTCWTAAEHGLASIASKHVDFQDKEHR